MLIDWFTVIAQMINFLLLVWLLKRFLYKPVLNAIGQREKQIASQLRDAETKKAEAEKEHEDFEEKNKTFDRQHDQLMNNAREEAEAERKKLFEKARTEMEAAREQWEEAMRKDQQQLGQEVIRRTQEEVFSIARKTLHDLASAGLEEQVTRIFIERLLSPGDQTAKAFSGSAGPLLVRSAFPLPEKQQHDIENALHKITGAATPVHFETAPEIVSGIEVSANGYKISWSINGYLAALEKNISGLLDEKLRGGKGTDKNE